MRHSSLLADEAKICIPRKGGLIHSAQCLSVISERKDQILFSSIDKVDQLPVHLTTPPPPHPHLPTHSPPPPPAPPCEPIWPTRPLLDGFPHRGSYTTPYALSKDPRTSPNPRPILQDRKTRPSSEREVTPTPDSGSARSYPLPPPLHTHTHTHTHTRDMD
jgi:hypothetical protein